MTFIFMGSLVSCHLVDTPLIQWRTWDLKWRRWADNTHKYIYVFFLSLRGFGPYKAPQNTRLTVTTDHCTLYQSENQ